MSKDPRVYLAQMLERIERIERFSAAGREAFAEDLMAQDAVIRNLEVIGEAAKRVPESFRKRHPDVPWRSLAALRDVLIHQYEGVSIAALWDVIQNHLPPLRAALAVIVPSLAQLERELAGEE